MTKTQRTVKRSPKTKAGKPSPFGGKIEDGFYTTVIQFGQSGRFETLAVSKRGICVLEKDGETKAINLKAACEWYAGIYGQTWWGTYEWNIDGVALWFSVLAKNLTGIAIADMTEHNRVFHPGRRK